jgi:hypothetical protein
MARQALQLTSVGFLVGLRLRTRLLNGSKREWLVAHTGFDCPGAVLCSWILMLNTVHIVDAVTGLRESYCGLSTSGSRSRIAATRLRMR